MTATFKPGVRYRMPAVFGPAPGPRQKPDGTPWLPEETGTMNSQWMTISYLTDAQKLETLLPPGFKLRGEPVVAVNFAFFNDLYWLAGRGYGIIEIGIPVTYTGKTEVIEGTFCPILWEGCADAIITGRDELGFPKILADIPPLSWDKKAGSTYAKASWFGHTFLEFSLEGLVESTEGPKKLPAANGPPMFFKYVPRSGPFGREGTDIAYVTTPKALPNGGENIAAIDFDIYNFKKWKASSGRLEWHRATFEEQPTTFHIVNGMAQLDILELRQFEMIEFSGPGIGISANAIRAVEPAEPLDLKSTIKQIA